VPPLAQVGGRAIFSNVAFCCILLHETEAAQSERLLVLPRCTVVKTDLQRRRANARIAEENLKFQI